MMKLRAREVPAEENIPRSLATTTAVAIKETALPLNRWQAHATEVSLQQESRHTLQI
jgi:hypothetical protein